MNIYSLVLKSKMEFKVHTKLYNFQKETVAFLQIRETQGKNSLILNEAGLGKSITMLKFIEASPLPTLIICPSNLIYNWLNEVLTHTNYTQSQVNIFHGSNRKINDALITISSYSVITNANKNTELFQKINNTFSRVILDEGQFIRNKKTLTSIAMLELTIPKRILMTATPIFNRIDDLYPIFKFLEFIGNRDDMKEMTSDINAIKVLNKFIKENSKRYLKANVLPEIKPHIIKPIMIKFSKIEQAFYDTLRDYCKSRIDKAQKRIENKFDKTLDKVMAGMILVFILRLKQCVNDPNSILKTMKRLNDCYTLPQATAYLLECKENPESECNICFDKIADFYAVECYHQCCAECWKRLTKNGVITCPHCRQIVTEVVKIDDIDKKPKELTLPESDLISSKIKAILNIINELVEKGEKVVVTSIFLDTLAEIKKHCNFEFIDITGSIPIKKRFENIEKFKNNDTIKICYLSLLAGSEGINLVSASNLILCDLYWNMAKLTQVYDRINRIGQKKQTYIYKVNVAGTIEKSLQKMINKKEKLSDMLLKNINQEKNYEEEMVMIEDKIEFF